MKKLLLYIEFGILGIFIWSILLESFMMENIIAGFILGIVTAIFSHTFLMGKTLHRAYYIHPFILVEFVFVLFYEIIKASIISIISIILGRANIVTVRIRTKVDKGLMTSSIANAITLIPGTVTVEKNQNILTVLWLDVKKTKTKSARKSIIGNLENILLKGYRND